MLLEVENLKVSFDSDDGVVEAVRGISFSLEKGETLGVVGESGSGKSQAMMALLGLLAGNGRAEGKALFHDRDLLSMGDAELNKIRGEKIALIFQDPMTSLNPYLTISKQMREVLEFHKGLSRSDAEAECIAMLEAVQLPKPKAALRRYPYEFSGGQRQRIMIAMALLCRPDLIIADEPTTALDVTVQAEILQLLQRLQGQFGMAIILITHDMGVAAGLCEHIQVMYQGEIKEQGTALDVFARPVHPYTKALLDCIPRLDIERERLPTVADYVSDGAAPVEVPMLKKPIPIDRSEPILAVDGLTVDFDLPGGKSLRAVNNVDFCLYAGETLGLVGESGSGKSTVARSILGLNKPTAGEIRWQNQSLLGLSQKALRPIRRDIQVVFQDPLASLDPRMTIGESIAEPLRTFEPSLKRRERDQQVADILLQVGLLPEMMNRYPHEFSGGQCQRVGIARALILKPKLLICDEAVSALDVSVQAQIVNLLKDLQQQLGLTLLFIAHDLSIVKHVSDRVLVMYHGDAVELADKHSIYSRPQHAYTQKLINAVPVPDPQIERARLLENA